MAAAAAWSIPRPAQPLVTRASYRDARWRVLPPVYLGPLSRNGLYGHCRVRIAFRGRRSTEGAPLHWPGTDGADNRRHQRRHALSRDSQASRGGALGVARNTDERFRGPV